jgi:hypothetical protein
MKVIRERKNRNKIECPNCGTYWFVDDNDEYINDGSAWSPDDEDNQENEDEGLSVYEAALIWASKGKDEDYMFGYTEEELEDAL